MYLLKKEVRKSDDFTFRIWGRKITPENQIFTFTYMATVAFTLASTASPLPFTYRCTLAT